MYQGQLVDIKELFFHHPGNTLWNHSSSHSSEVISVFNNTSTSWISPRRLNALKKEYNNNLLEQMIIRYFSKMSEILFI